MAASCQDDVAATRSPRYAPVYVKAPRASRSARDPPSIAADRGRARRR